MLVLYLICITVLFFSINFCTDLLNMFFKHEFKLEMFVAVCWSYDNRCISILMSSVQLDYISDANV